MHPLTKDIIESNGQDALQKVMSIPEIEDIWNGCIQASALFATITKEPPNDLRILWDVLLSELNQLIETNETDKSSIGLYISKWVLFYQRVKAYGIKVPEPLTHFATLKSKITALLSLRITMTEGGYTRFYSILSRKDGETVEKACALLSYLFSNKRYTECRLLMEYMSRRKSTLGTYSSMEEFLWEASLCYFKQDSRILIRSKIYQWMEHYKGGKYRTEASGILWMNAFGLIAVPKETPSLWTNEEEYILSQVQQLLGSLEEPVPSMLQSYETETPDLWEFMNDFVPKSLPKYDLPNPEPIETKTIRIKQKR